MLSGNGMKMKISIFTPSNSPKYLEALYNSIKHQDFYEWVIVPQNYEIKFDDPRIKVFELPCMEGARVGALKNYACSKCSGDILLELDHDDFLADNAIEEVRKAFEDETVGFVYSNAVYFKEGFEPYPKFSEAYGWTYREVEYEGHKLNEHISFEAMPASVSRIWYAPNHLRAFRKSVYEQAGGYDKQMSVLDDQDLMSRMYAITKFSHINKPLYFYRVHGENAWLKRNKEIQDNVYPIYDRHIETMARKWAHDNGLHCIDLGGGIDKKDGYTSVDLKGSDIIADLERPFPFKDNSVGVIRAYDVLEHLKDSIHTMKEIYRVLASDGWLFAKVPSTDGRGAFQDPTHKSYWNENSFLYYTNYKWARYIDVPVRFQKTRLYTTEKNANQVSWVIANLIKLSGNRPPGIIEI
jgi:glycosyltransferase involved in cell wall biosynthesis